MSTNQHSPMKPNPSQAWIELKMNKLISNRYCYECLLESQIRCKKIKWLQAYYTHVIDVAMVIVIINIVCRARTGNGRSTNCKSSAGFWKRRTRLLPSPSVCRRLAFDFKLLFISNPQCRHCGYLVTGHVEPTVGR